MREDFFVSLEYIFVFVGAPGSGKGTVGKALEELGTVISTRGLLEENACCGFIEEGSLAPDDLMCQLLTKKLEECHGIVMIDMLRSIMQCEALSDFVNTRLNLPIIVRTINLDIHSNVALARMKERGRPDDGKAVERLEQYTGSKSKNVSGYGPAVLKYLTTVGQIDHVNANLDMFSVINRVRDIIQFHTHHNEPGLIIPPAIRPGSFYPKPAS